MTKKIFVFIFLILSINFVVAVDIEVKSEVLKGENLIVKVSGNFIQPLTKDNIEFYRRHIQTSMGFYDLFKIENDYYIYVKIPLEKVADNYSIVIKDSQYRQGNKVVTDDISGDFEIKEDSVSFLINPGILKTSGEYEITLENLRANKISVNYNQIERGASGSNVVVINEENETEEKSFLDSIFDIFSTTGNETIISGDEPILESQNIVELLSGEAKTIKLNPKNYVGFQEVEFNYGNESYNVIVWADELIVNEPVLNESIINNVTIIEENKTEIINETTNESVENITINNVTQNKAKTCDELGGSICKEGEICAENNITYSKSAVCCLSECQEVEKSSSGKTVGWVIIIIIALFLTWFFKNKWRGSGRSPVRLFKK